jgi:hypothetical protein
MAEKSLSLEEADSLKAQFEQQAERFGPPETFLATYQALAEDGTDNITVVALTLKTGS